ncbi:MAG: cell surface protein [Deltaproteobacteria bacterium]|nr:cell surface protein [Deltaproteobacteria bacterium]
MNPRPFMLAVAGLVLAALSSGCTESLDPDAGLDDGAAVPQIFDPVEGRCEEAGQGRGDAFADCVEQFSPAPAVSFGHDAMPSIVLGPPAGAGTGMGSMDVASLGCGGSITLHFSEPWPVDIPGPDFIVFENPFVAGDSTFVEPGQVSVSADGDNWRVFDCEPDGSPEAPPSCAGLRPVLASDGTAATAVDTAGGDAFDLADVGLDYARYVRIEDRTAEHYDSETWCAGAAGGFDLDAVAVVGDNR